MIAFSEPFSISQQAHSICVQLNKEVTLFTAIAWLRKPLSALTHLHTVAMNFNLFKPKQKTPPELVRNLKDAVHRLDTSDKRKVSSPVPGIQYGVRVDSQRWLPHYHSQANEDISKTLLAMKTILYGDGGLYFFSIS